MTDILITLVQLIICCIQGGVQNVNVFKITVTSSINTGQYNAFNSIVKMGTIKILIHQDLLFNFFFEHIRQINK